MAAFFIAYQTREEVGAMAQRGRKPKPTALKMLEGNPGGRPLNTKEPKPEKKAPRCPSWLEDEAKKEWKRMAKVLENMGLLTEMDMAAFAGVLSGVCPLEGSRGIPDAARLYGADAEWLSAAGAAGIHRPD